MAKTRIFPPSFNSIMVRLKGLFTAPDWVAQYLFQFHHGTIKRIMTKQEAIQQA